MLASKIIRIELKYARVCAQKKSPFSNSSNMRECVDVRKGCCESDLTNEGVRVRKEEEDEEDERGRRRRKESLRKKMRERLRANKQEILNTQKKQSQLVCEKIVKMKEFESARVVCAYVALEKLFEVDVSSIITMALESDKEVYVPIVDDKNSNCRFLRIRDLDRDVVRRTMGIMEPTEIDWRTNERREDLQKSEGRKVDIVICPGLAFDKACNRLGRGGGYYDKFMSSSVTRDSLKIGVCFDDQIVSNDDNDDDDDALIPLDPWDVVLDRIVAPSYSFFRKNCNQSQS